MRSANPTSTKRAAVAALAVVLGFVGLIFVFSDPGPGEGWPLRIVIAAAYFLLAGAAVGYAQPSRWPVAGPIAWGGLLMGAFIILSAIARYGREAFAAVEPPYISSGLIMSFGSLGLSLLGGFLGKSLPRRKAPTAHG